MCFNKIGFIVFLTFFIILCAGIVNSPLYANKSDKKSRIAVFPITTINVPENYGETIRNELEYQLTNSGQLDVLERQIILKILAEKKIKKQKLSNVAQILAADYMVTGSIELVDSYILKIKVISGESGKILFVYSQKYQDKNDYGKCAKFVSEKIVRDIQYYVDSNIIETYDSPSFLIGFSTAFIYPIGTFSKIADYGVGFCFNGCLERNNYNFLLSAGYIHYSTSNKDIHELATVPLMLGFGYKIKYDFRFYFLPYIYSGIHYVIANKNNMSGNNTNQAEFSLEPGIGFGFNMTSSISLLMKCGYLFIYEKDNPITGININFGINYML